MTGLKRPVRRELPITFDRRQWTVEVHGWGLVFRAKRERRTFEISWESVLHRAHEIAAYKAVADKIAARNARK